MMYDDGMLGLCEWKNILSTGTVSPWTRPDKRQSRGDKTAPPSPWPLHGQYSGAGSSLESMTLAMKLKFQLDLLSTDLNSRNVMHPEVKVILQDRCTRRYHKTYPTILTSSTPFRSFSIVHSLLESLRVTREETRRLSLLPTLQPEFFT